LFCAAHFQRRLVQAGRRQGRSIADARPTGRGAVGIRLQK
jgi:hypothetical protein